MLKLLVFYFYIMYLCSLVCRDRHTDFTLLASQGSYVLDYFKALVEYLSVGPPVYFVVQAGHNYTSIEGQNQICAASGCPENAMLGQIFKSSLISNR